MKKLILPLIICLCSFSGFAQSDYKLAKGDAQIVVASDLTFVEVAKTLMDHGYTIDKLDTVLNNLTTTPRGIPTINGEYYLNIIKKDTQYKVVGMYRFNFTATLAGISPTKGAFEVAKYTKSQSPQKRVFNEAWKAANGIGTLVTVMK